MNLFLWRILTDTLIFSEVLHLYFAFLVTETLMTQEIFSKTDRHTHTDLLPQINTLKCSSESNRTECYYGEATLITGVTDSPEGEGRCL